MNVYALELEALHALAGAIVRSGTPLSAKSGDLSILADALASLPAKFPERAAAMRSVSLVTAADASDPHLSVVIGYLLSLLTLNSLEVVEVVFTGEFCATSDSPDKYRERTRARFLHAFAEHVRLCGGHVDDGAMARVRVHVRPSVEEFIGIVGEAVIRFEGAVPSFTTYLAARALHRARPVVTATFSSKVRKGVYSDLTLVRGRVLDGDQVAFVPAITVPPPLRVDSTDAGRDGTLLTAYGQNRLCMAVATLTLAQWDAVVEYLRGQPQARWLMIGAEDPSEVSKRIPDSLPEEVRSRIDIRGREPLAPHFPRASAFLALPGVFGGALGALQAIRAGCLLVSVVDPDSDISNFMPAALQHRSFTEAMRVAGHYASRSTERAEVLGSQRRVVDALSDYTSKGRELIGALQNAERRWQARRKVSATQPFPQWRGRP